MDVSKSKAGEIDPEASLPFAGQRNPELPGGGQKLHTLHCDCWHFCLDLALLCGKM